ncbi:hypothetical protein Cgig2_031789 [Carnegiea gigantea]|uniref:Uncharacterized protein n=1 Tax=Carnegiea gigantea TaxID=171969 RepID=A0A9Q1GRM9_9CARY|nr:hypothetical protein Cgig2_031789 [Carnegiea gigantea]
MRGKLKGCTVLPPQLSGSGLERMKKKKCRWGGMKTMVTCSPHDRLNEVEKASWARKKRKRLAADRSGSRNDGPREKKRNESERSNCRLLVMASISKDGEPSPIQIDSATEEASNLASSSTSSPTAHISRNAQQAATDEYFELDELCGDVMNMSLNDDEDGDVPSKGGGSSNEVAGSGTKQKSILLN